jgi:hypothetical protein
MRLRIQEELALLHRFFPDVEHLELNGEDWFRIPNYHFPPGWKDGDKNVDSGPVIFKLQPTYPTAEPYGFSISSGITYEGTRPNNICQNQSPFAGSWQQFSWQPEGTWNPNNQTDCGSNLLSWVRSFRLRLAEGV